MEGVPAAASAGAAPGLGLLVIGGFFGGLALAVCAILQRVLSGGGGLGVGRSIKRRGAAM
ncbi:hypothetical protein DMH04_43625 [Kibdelosporangium aridum]|uniref:Uncharacterized protein n=1 Tax=Kibdelosporangium aridum TaxID=2030 RepID=A0A428YRK2_KIBAR|nr:hypothetical protein DMH04_43625 [Kibdelosporangium aridum]